jgi:hypothetical protein
MVTSFTQPTARKISPNNVKIPIFTVTNLFFFLPLAEKNPQGDLAVTGKER